MGIIEKQSIRSSIIIFLGFAIGGINMVVLAPKILTPEELGLTRIITDAAATVASMATLGCLPVIYKFFPFYKHYLSENKRDLIANTFVVCMIGFILMSIAAYFSYPLIERKFSERSPLFVSFSYTVMPFAFFFLLFIWLESIALSNKRSVLNNTLKETVFRIFFTALLVLFGMGFIHFSAFINLFSLSWLLPSALLIIILFKHKELVFNFKISSLTRRLKGKMISFGLFIFGASFLNLLARTADTFILSAKAPGGLKDAAIFTIATYVVTLMDVPQRSLNSITIPVLAEAWKNKDYSGIKSIYRKSVNNLEIIALFMFGIMLLNVSNLAAFLGKDYDQIIAITLLMGMGKLIDLSTGANAQIIGTSHFWKVDFFTNVIYTIIALPLNYILISNFGLMGAAYANLFSITIFNLMRFGFLWHRLKFQPYTFKNLLIAGIAFIAGYLTYLIPPFSSIFIDAFVRTIVFSVLLLPIAYYLKISLELNEMFNRYVSKITRRKN